MPNWYIVDRTTRTTLSGPFPYAGDALCYQVGHQEELGTAKLLCDETDSAVIGAEFPIQ